MKRGIAVFGVKKMDDLEAAAGSGAVATTAQPNCYAANILVNQIAQGLIEMVRSSLIQMNEVPPAAQGGETEAGAPFLVTVWCCSRKWWASGSFQATVFQRLKDLRLQAWNGLVKC